MDFLLSKIIRSKSVSPTFTAMMSADQIVQQQQQHPEMNTINEISDESPTTNQVNNNQKVGLRKSLEKSPADITGAENNDITEQIASTNIAVSEKGSSKAVEGTNVDGKVEQKIADKEGFEKSEISSTDGKFNPSVLPDIVNVQPSISGNLCDSPLSNLAKHLERLKVDTPTGRQSPLAAPNSINSNVPSALSSDDEFSECQTTSDLGNMDSTLNQSIRWDNVVSSVTSTCNDSLENTVEQFDPSPAQPLDLKPDNDVADNTNNEAAAGDGPKPISQNTSEANQSGELGIADTTVTENLKTSNDSEKSEIVNSDSSLAVSVVVTGPPDDLSTTPQPANVTIKIEPTTPVENLDATMQLSTTSSAQLANVTIEIEPTTPVENLDATFLTSTADATVILTEPKPAALDSTFLAAATAADASVNVNAAAENQSAMDECVTKIKKEIYNEIEAKSSAASPKQPTSPPPQQQPEPEPMDIDESLADGQAPQLNSTEILSKTRCDRMPEEFNENSPINLKDDVFKMPAIPPPNFGNMLRQNPGQYEFNEEFSSMILNPSDFDYLLSRGNDDDKNVTVERSSLLLKFDPLLGRPKTVNNFQQQQQLPEGNRLNSTTNLSHFESRLSPAFEENDSEQSGGSFRDQHDLDATLPISDTVTINLGSDTINVTETSSPSNSSDSVHVNSKQIKDRINRSQPEDKKGNVKMSVDVIQDMKIENDVKSIENINIKTEEKKDFKMAELEKKIKNENLKTEDVEKKLKEAEQREEALLKRIAEKDRTITKMSGILEAYEKAIAELIAEKEQIIQNYEKKMAEIKADRDLNYQHLSSLEATFSDLHAKYERSKEVAETLRASEEALAAEKKQHLENLRLQEQRYDKMKSHALQQLEMANNKLESNTKNHSVEVTKLKALLKKEEISRLSVNEQLMQKARENEELVKICDELINGQGSS